MAFRIGDRVRVKPTIFRGKFDCAVGHVLGTTSTVSGSQFVVSFGETISHFWPLELESWDDK